MSTVLNGKVALVTGGGSGIGRATAQKFAALGASVVVADIDEASAIECARQISDDGGEASAWQADVSKGDAVRAMVESAVSRYGKLDYAFNNAGIEGAGGSVVECTEENWARTIAIDLTGVFLCMKYEIPHMVEAGGGAIVNTASVAGLAGTPGLPAYGAAKHGVVGLTKGGAGSQTPLCAAPCRGPGDPPSVFR